MGKKTDKAISDLNAKANACQLTASNLAQVCAAWPAINAEWDKWEDEMRALADWEQHPYAKRRIAHWQKGKDLAAKLAGEVAAMSKPLSDFRTYIAKKEKSKNPFKSKKSLPQAKQMLKLYDSVLQEFNALVTKARGLFH